MTNEKKPTLTVIAGPNGSGKTTIAKPLLAHKWTADATYVNADDIAKEKFGDWNSVQAIRQAAAYADSLREQYLEEGRDFVYETVFSTSRRPEDLQKAKERGFFVRFFFVCTKDPDINVSRVKRRVITGGHNVPEDKIGLTGTFLELECHLAFFLSLKPIFDFRDGQNLWTGFRDGFSGRSRVSAYHL